MIATSTEQDCMAIFFKNNNPGTDFRTIIRMIHIFIRRLSKIEYIIHFFDFEVIKRKTKKNPKTKQKQRNVSLFLIKILQKIIVHFECKYEQ